MYQRILVPVDGSPTSMQGLDEAIKLAKLTGASLRLVHVVDQLTFATGYETYTADLVGMLREGGQKILVDAKGRAHAAGIDASDFLCDTFGSRVCDIVVDQAKDWAADLIVIGSHGRRGMSRLILGSDAEQVVRVARVPVLLVHGSDAVASPSSRPGREAAVSVASAVPA